MIVVPFVHEGLGNSSYLVALDEKRAVLVDPDRSVQRYIDTARSRAWNIEAVLETHVHADFVSGAREIAAATDATLFIPRGSHVRLAHQPVDPARRIRLDGLEIEAVGSPGHTPEHLSYVLRPGVGPPTLFSGGSLLVGGAARTDLISPEQTEQLTREQFRTLSGAFATLPDETLLYPTHGGGSFCSAGAGATRTSTLGAERASNPVLAVADEDEFVNWFPTTFPSAPRYYFRMRAFNQAGPRLRRDIAMPQRRSPEEFEEASRTALIIDTRSVEAYSAAHIRGSLHIPFRDSFAVWLGWLVPADTRLLFIIEAGLVDAVVNEALLVGYEDFGGWLDGGVETWQSTGRPVSSTDFVEGAAARTLISDGAEVIDVREPSEMQGGFLPEARLVPLGRLQANETDGTSSRPVVVYCGQGERASTAASLLERAGRTRVVNVRGGYGAIAGRTERAPS